MSKSVLLLEGDGIGPDIMAEAIKVLKHIQNHSGLDVQLEHELIGGAAIDACGEPITEACLARAQNADAVLLAAVGGPKWDHCETALRPERGLLRLRQAMGVYANLRPAVLYPQLADASTLKPEVVKGLDMLIVRELTGGIYFGQPRGIENTSTGQRKAFNTMVYSEGEIERIAHIAFRAAQKRKHRLCSVDKANVLEVSMLWRDVVSKVADAYPDVELSHLYIDNAAMQLVRDPTQFDVIVTSNLFGDILSDCSAMLTGSIGMLASASLNEHNRGLYEPVHGSAPDIAGQGKANPIAMILSVAMMLRYTWGEEQLAHKIESAVLTVLKEGIRTFDLVQPGRQYASTQEMGDAVVRAMGDL